MIRITLVVLFLVICAQCAVPGDQITHLPGLGVMPEWRQYSGYLSATGTKKLHYWLIESTGNASSDPMVLWLNGGPGCSSMLGLLTETGPFKISSDGKTVLTNQYSWNKMANVLYLDSPAGAGFSYSSDKNYTTNDDLVAMDNVVALRDFFSKYPEFNKNDFYITGESYAGIYIPTLAERIVSLNAPLGNFVGFAVGNGQSDFQMTTDAMVYFSYFHGLIGEEMWTNLTDNCCHGDSTNCQFFKKMREPQCKPVMNMFYAQVYGSGINFCNIYSPRPAGSMHSHSFNPATVSSGPAVSPCADYTNLYDYLNQNDTREALHIPVDVQTWVPCSDAVQSNYKTLYTSMSAQYKTILSTQKKILVYNGDVDLVCGPTSGEWFVDSLNQTVMYKRQPWHYMAPDGSKQIAGFVKGFQGITFATVKGAGHMAPADKPEQASILFTAFMQNRIPE